MIDFVKIEIPFYNRGKLLKNKLLDFKGNYSMTSGEVNEIKIIAEYNGMKFISYSSNRMEIRGSIHKYFNFLSKVKAPNQISSEQIAKGYNGNIFNLTQLKYAIYHLCNLIEIKPNEAVLRGFEYGLNIHIKNDCETFLNALLHHKYKEFSNIKDNSQHYRQVKYQRFKVKCYNKQIQYKLKKSVIRFENRQFKMTDLSDLPIKTLKDLSKRDTLEDLKIFLLKKWDEVLMFDFTIKRDQLNTVDQVKVKDLSNPLFWHTIKSNHKHRPKEKLKELSLKYGSNIQNQFKEQLKKQWELQNQNCVTFNQLFKNTNCVKNNHSVKQLIVTQNLKVNKFNNKTLNSLEI